MSRLQRAPEEVTLRAWDDLQRAIEAVECALPQQMSAAIKALTFQKKRFEDLMLGRAQIKDIQHG